MVLSLSRQSLLYVCASSISSFQCTREGRCSFSFLAFEATAVSNTRFRYTTHVHLHSTCQYRVVSLRFSSLSHWCGIRIVDVMGAEQGEKQSILSVHQTANKGTESTPRRTTSIQYPSGSKMKAILLIFPSVRRFWNGTPSLSKRAQAASTSSTVIAMWPNPRGSELPEW